MPTPKLLPYACDRCRLVLTLLEGDHLCDIGHPMVRVDSLRHANLLIAGYRTWRIDDEGDDSDANDSDDE